MQKLIPALILSGFAAFTLTAQAASHAGAAPMKASEPAMKKEEAKPAMKKEEAKPAMKKEEAKPAEKKASAPK